MGIRSGDMEQMMEDQGTIRLMLTAAENLCRFCLPASDEQLEQAKRELRIEEFAQASSGYVGTVLSPCVLIRASYQSRQIKDQFGCCGGYVSMAKFCERSHLPQPEQRIAEKMEIGGMSL